MIINKKNTKNIKKKGRGRKDRREFSEEGDRFV